MGAHRAVHEREHDDEEGRGDASHDYDQEVAVEPAHRKPARTDPALNIRVGVLRTVGQGGRVARATAVDMVWSAERKQGLQGR